MDTVEDVTFEKLQLLPQLQRALLDAEYRQPTPIQAQAIPPAMAGRDILGKAQTGTGKTAAFALPILHHLGTNNQAAIRHRPVALVLAPTRELAVQIAESFASYGKHLRLRTALVFGGVSQMHQVRALERGVHLVVATPGRLLDLMQQGHVRLDQLKYFVLDEADRMLDMGFLPDLERIMQRLPAARQSLFFSATTPPPIVELSRQLLRDPVQIDVAPRRVTIDAIEQRVMLVENRDKFPALQTLLEDKPQQTLVFTRTKHAANNLAKRLIAAGVQAAAIHGNKSQSARQAALMAFRRRQVQVLVATDIVARGIDIDEIGLVVNYDLPDEPESYVHRIGRTGRCGASGTAVSFCSTDQRSELRAIEKLIGQRVTLHGTAHRSAQLPRQRSESERSRESRRTAPRGKSNARRPSFGRRSRTVGSR